MQEIPKKKVLFIGPQFFGYEILILEGLKEKGFEVDFLPDRPFVSPLMKAVTRFRRQWIIPFADKFYLDSIKDLKSDSYEYVFVVQGEGLSLNTLSNLRTVFHSARFIWYLWDSLRNKKLLVPNIPMFDKCFTFDKQDADYYGINFRPLFYAPGFSAGASKNFKYELSFIGTMHSDRYEIISNLIRQLPENARYFWYFYLQAPWVFWLKKITNSSFYGVSIDRFKFTPLKKNEVEDVFFESFAILDIEHPKQTGLTMRTFEALGAKKKLITTNQHVKNYDFYHPDNILVINRKSSFSVPKSFFIQPYRELPVEKYIKYSLNGWLTEIFAS
jgi:hypothetical protein